MYVFIFFGYVWVTEWLPIGKIAAQLANYVFLVELPDCLFSFSHNSFWSGNFFLVAPFPYHCLLLLFSPHEN